MDVIQLQVEEHTGLKLILSAGEDPSIAAYLWKEINQKSFNMQSWQTQVYAMYMWEALMKTEYV